MASLISFNNLSRAQVALATLLGACAMKTGNKPEEMLDASPAMDAASTIDSSPTVPTLRPLPPDPTTLVMDYFHDGMMETRPIRVEWSPLGSSHPVTQVSYCIGEGNPVFRLTGHLPAAPYLLAKNDSPLVNSDWCENDPNHDLNWGVVCHVLPPIFASTDIATFLFRPGNLGNNESVLFHLTKQVGNVRWEADFTMMLGVTSCLSTANDPNSS